MSCGARKENENKLEQIFSITEHVRFKNIEAFTKINILVFTINCAMPSALKGAQLDLCDFPKTFPEMTGLYKT